VPAGDFRGAVYPRKFRERESHSKREEFISDGKSEREYLREKLTQDVRQQSERGIKSKKLVSLANRKIRLN